MFRSNEDVKAKIFFDVCLFNYCPQRSWGKVMSLHVSVILFTGGVVSQAVLQVVSQHSLQQVSGGGRCGIQAGLAGGIPACLAAGFGRSPGPHLGGGVEGCGQGGLLAHTWGVSRPPPGGSPGPHLGGLQAHTWGGLQAHTWGGSSGPHPGGLQAYTWGVSRLTPEGRCIPVCIEADAPPCGRLLLWTVRILLEYILVFFIMLSLAIFAWCEYALKVLSH